MALVAQVFEPGYVLAPVSQQSLESATYPAGAEKPLAVSNLLPHLSLSLSRYHVGTDWQVLFTQPPEQEHWVEPGLHTPVQAPFAQARPAQSLAKRKRLPSARRAQLFAAGAGGVAACWAAIT